MRTLARISHRNYIDEGLFTLSNTTSGHPSLIMMIVLGQTRSLISGFVRETCTISLRDTRKRKSSNNLWSCESFAHVYARYVCILESIKAWIFNEALARFAPHFLRIDGRSVKIVIVVDPITPSDETRWMGGALLTDQWRWSSTCPRAWTCWHDFERKWTAEIEQIGCEIDCSRVN